MPLPMMTVSGIRGVVNETIDELFITKIAYTQTKLAHGGTIVVGRDTRPSGEAFARAAFRGIRAAGGTPVDLGIAPTPTTCFAAAALKANGGIILTASHNPTPYNGYKMVHSSGRLYRASECEDVYNEFHKGIFPAEEEFATISDSADKTVDAATLHIERILSTVDV
ncbi:MAG: hypothetical protein OQK82_00885, partial [Candidatus Pacearchaeota archaeon]|nr:hypothetical protein [Candidatus Pacearchaeota archaeon]